MKRVIVESPLRADTPEGYERNRRYARACMRDCLLRGEAPFASHLLYDQIGILDDTVPEERLRGMHAGFAWGRAGELVAVYTDLGISSGMECGIELHEANGLVIEQRTLPGWGET